MPERRMSPIDSQGMGPDAALFPCQVCGRTFSADRVHKHQAICLKVRKKRPVFRAEKQRVFMEGGSGGSVAGTALQSTSHHARLGARKALRTFSSASLNTKWREQSWMPQPTRMK
ncbi:ZC2HC1B [Symbiodinium pilosum]|uniref:ZC2HC1B protein n=1 Tax=Symbiodinium pilosum TaxID=2952 RepID=A0A812JQ54_SYMPI|nr:ZC2HC1B [Symbiodinium pilosum]